MYTLLFIAIVVVLWFIRVLFSNDNFGLDVDADVSASMQKSRYYKTGFAGVTGLRMPRKTDPSLDISRIYDEAYRDMKAAEYISQYQNNNQEEIKNEPAEMPVLKMDSIEENDNLIEENKVPIEEEESINNIKISEERNVDL